MRITKTQQREQRPDHRSLLALLRFRNSQSGVRGNVRRPASNSAPTRLALTWIQGHDVARLNVDTDGDDSKNHGLQRGRQREIAWCAALEAQA